MGNVTSKPAENAAGTLYLKDQTRCKPSAILTVRDSDLILVCISSATVTNGRNRTVLHISPNEYPATKYHPRKEPPDESLVDYIGVWLQYPIVCLSLTSLIGPRRLGCSRKVTE
jgi:Arf-GAP/SH3 domain/ANK repeat/PH domain-containing protein